MSKIVGILFPWRKTFKRLQLEKRWWHRLAVVLFYLALIIAFWFSLAIGSDGYAPVHSIQQDIHHWGGSNGNGMLFDLDSFQPVDNTSQPAPQQPPPPVVQKTIEMPDGTTTTYPGTTSDEAINAEWNHKLDAATHRALILGFVVAVLVILSFSYLLQASYRALLYVIYGANAGTAPGN
jgi:hypothetical protein